MPTDKRARQKAARRQKIESQRRSRRRRSTTWRVLAIFLVVAVIITVVAVLANSGPSGAPLNQSQVNALAVSNGCPASPSTRANVLQWAKAPAMTINAAQSYFAHIRTTQGTVVVQLLPHEAPITVNNFVFLAKEKYYDCNAIPRVIPGFAIQTGDPTGTTGGGPGYTIADEYPKIGNPTYPKYSVAMANTGKPHTGGSQFFIVTCSTQPPNCLQPSYSLFGKVVSGFHAVDVINNQGNSNQQSNGIPPTVINRMLTVTVTNQQ